MGKAHSLAYAAMPMFFWPAPAIPARRIIADATDELAADAAARFGFTESTADWRRVVEHPAVDLVDIATPNHLHAEIAAAAAAAGKHIISEKPLARTGEEAGGMYRAVTEADVVNMVAFSYRRTPAVALAKRYIDDGSIGRVLNFRGTYLQDWSADPDSPLSWRFRKDVAGSGALGDIGTHVLDLARYLVGEIARVNSVASTFVPERPQATGTVDTLGASRAAGAPRGQVDVDDEVLTTLRFTSGAVGTLEASRNAWGRNNFLTFEIHGTAGSLLFNYERRDELRVALASDGDDRGFRTIYTGPAHPYGEAMWPIPALGIGFGETKIIECHDLCEAIATGGKASPDFADGYQIARICDAILESAESGRWVQISELTKDTTAGASHG
jgi:predicted dehydrogenase